MNWLLSMNLAAQAELFNKESGFGNDWLSNFNSIILPDRISWWPQSIGFMLLMVLALLVLVVVLRSRYKAWQAGAYHRVAVQQIKQLQADYLSTYAQAPASDSQAVSEVKLRADSLRQLQSVLRQFALCYWPREEIVRLVGQSWLDFLNQSSSQAAPELLSQLAYLPDQKLHAISQADGDYLFTWSAQWLNTVKSKCPLTAQLNTQAVT